MANQNNGALNYNVRFGNGQNYDSFESSSSNKETKSFWQKWEGVIIGGAGLLCVSILGVIGYNKGWFKKASDKIKDKTGETASKTASNAPKNVLNLETSLKTLKISSQSFNGHTISDMIKKGNISKRELQAVATKLKNIKNKENKENQAAIIFILNQLRQRLDDSVQIEGFKKEDAKEINGTNLDKILENIIKEDNKIDEEGQLEKDNKVKNRKERDVVDNKNSKIKILEEFKVKKIITKNNAVM